MLGNWHYGQWSTLEMRSITLVVVAAASLVVTSAEARHRHAYRHGHQYTRYDGGSIVSHPAGCPRSLFCGCGAAVEVFGRPIRELWLAANWLRYPRTSPAPGMVAARHGHVMVLRAQAGGNNWVVYDANSGGGATRVHVRSLAGYTIVNPHG